MKYDTYKPWLSESLKKCIKHKNRLYYQSIKYRTAYNELMYTTYRNKLKNILNKTEKAYYSKLLDANKSSMKKTWSILKQVINKKKHVKSQTQFKLSDGALTTDQSVISEKFNDFFYKYWTESCRKNSWTNHYPQLLSWQSNDEFNISIRC